MDSQNVITSSSSTLSILSLGAESPPTNQVSEYDSTPVSSPYQHNQESLVTLFSLSVKRSKETPESFSSAIHNEKCTCMQF